MTVNGISTIKLMETGTDSKAKTSEYNEGDIIKGQVVDVRDTSISIATDQDGQRLDFALDKAIGLNVSDRVQVEVLKVDVDKLQLSIKKIEEDKQAITSHDPLADSVNFDRIKRAVAESSNPMSYSEELDHHVDHALSQVETMLDSYTDDDIKAILRQGFDPEKMTIELLYQVGHSGRIDKKIGLSKHENQVEIHVNDEKINQLINDYANKHILSSSDQALVGKTVKTLVNNNLPVTQQNVEKILSFTDKVDKVKAMKEQDIVNFLVSDKVSSIGELYKSTFVSYDNKKDLVSETQFNAIKEDVNRLMQVAFKGLKSLDDQESLAIDKQGLPNQEESGKTGEVTHDFTFTEKELESLFKALVKKGVPLDQRTINTIKYIGRDVNLDETIEQGVNQLAINEKPDHLLISEAEKGFFVPKQEEVESFINLVKSVEPGHITHLVVNHKPVNFRELEYAVEELDSTSSLESSKKLDPQASTVINENVADLEIIRYQMTYKAAMRLSIEGLDLKSESLSQLRKRLETIKIDHVDVKTSPKDSSMNKLEEMDKLSNHEQAIVQVERHMAIIAGANTRSLAEHALDRSQVKTLETIASSAVRAVDAANRYDDLRTEVRPDLGDQIEKAFANTPEILKDLGMEVSEYNTRAVEILARNEMAISKENILSVKELDFSLQELFNKMMPEHIKELTDMNVDVMKEPIENLVDFVRSDEAKVRVSASETVAKQILSMTRNGELTDPERKTLIGVYRMVHTIESSKGAALGFLVDKKMDVTLENLFDVAKVIAKAKGRQAYLDVDIDDAFGELDSIKRPNLSIKEQIRSGFMEKENQVNQVLHQQSPTSNEDVEALRQVLTNIKNMDKTTLKDVISFDNVRMGDLNKLSHLDMEKPWVKESLEAFSQFMDDDQEIVNHLQQSINDFANDPGKEGQGRFAKEIQDMLYKVSNKVTEDYLDHQESELNAGHSLTRISKDKEKSVVDVTKDLSTTLNIQRQLIEEDNYYRVPVMVNGEMQEMSMYYFRKHTDRDGENDEMSVYLSFHTNRMGNVNMKVDLNHEDTQVTVFATEDAGNQELKAYSQGLEEVFSRIGISDAKINYDHFKFPKPIKKNEKIAQTQKVKKYNSKYEQLV